MFYLNEPRGIDVSENSLDNPNPGVEDGHNHSDWPWATLFHAPDRITDPNKVLHHSINQQPNRQVSTLRGHTGYRHSASPSSPQRFAEIYPKRVLEPPKSKLLFARLW